MPPRDSLEKLTINAAVCRDFLYFRQLLAKSRGFYDDNVKHRLNNVDTTNSKQCRNLLESLDHVHRDRREKLHFCINSLREEYETTQSSITLKELSLLESELTTEDIVYVAIFKLTSRPRLGLTLIQPGQCRTLIGRVEMSSEFPARLFPTSFTLLYCSYENCSHEVPFTDPTHLIQHVEMIHGMIIREPAAVIPFLDRYLDRRLREGLERIEASEDAKLRNELQQERLQEILNLQEQERNSIHRTGRHCLFCHTYMSNYYKLFSHMFSAHDFNIGHLDNLVMVAEFLDTLQKQLNNKICIFCEGKFPSMSTLKKHLKNKGHYRIHPQNHLYDKHYIVNYLQPGKLYDESSERATKELWEDNDIKGGNDDDNDDAMWETLTEELCEQTMCLLCSHVSQNPDLCINHMVSRHEFDWDRIIRDNRLDDLESIMFVNYMRHRQVEAACIYCESVFEAETELIRHMEGHKPFALPPQNLLSDSRNLLPVFDDDPIIWSIRGMSILD